MSIRHFCRLGALLLALPLGACHSLVDLDVTYQECVDVTGQRYAEGFGGEDLQTLRDRCWRVDNEGIAPGGVDQKIFVEDGDLVMRVDDTATATDRDEWTASDQAPMLYRRIEGDFLVVVRAEASSKATADHCNLQGNNAGLVIRQAEDPSAWATWTVEPYLWTSPPPGADCRDDADETNNPTATVRLRSSDPGWSEYDKDGVGIDGEADLAICRVGGKVYYQFGQATSEPTKNNWLPDSASVASHSVGAGPVDVGLTAAGSNQNFSVAGHFNWVVFERGVYGDGCAGALEFFELPEGD